MQLLERDTELGVLNAVVEGALSGQGAGVALAGESGIGKSALLEALSGDIGSARLLRAHCDPLDTPRPLGPFLDLQHSAGIDVLGRGDELLRAEVCERVFTAISSEPTVLIIEDIHWIDAASVDVLRFLARRIESIPLALIVSYRDREIHPRHSARPLLGDVASLDGLSQVALKPLTIEAVRSLLEGTNLKAERVHAVTGGNPFFVGEVAKEPGLPLPVSVRDAVLAHTSDVSPSDFEVLQLVATAPDRLVDRVLPVLGVDLPTLRRLDETALLTRTADGIVFRHELARQAIESTIPPGGSARLHALLLDALERIEPRDPAVLTHHAVGARDRARATTYAQQAAQEATRVGSHSEAAAFFETALEHLDSDDPRDRARLLLELAYEQYMISQLREAINNVRATFPLWDQAGDTAGLAASHEAAAVFEYYSARRREAEAHSGQAAALTAGPDITTDVAYGGARVTQGFLAFKRNDIELAREYVAEAHRVADERDQAQLALRSDVVWAASGMVSGEEGARSQLLEHAETARTRGWDDLASTGYSQVVSLDVEHGRLRAAEQLLELSIPFAVDRDIAICKHWQVAVRSRLHLQQGHWSAALEDAEAVLDGAGMPVANLWPHLVMTLVPLRRGDEVPTDALGDAWSLAEQINEPLARLGVLAAAAEVSWMTERLDQRVTELAVAELPELGAQPGADWAAGHLAVWLHRLGLPVTAPSGFAEPFRLTLEGSPTEAARWWHLAGDPFAEAMAWTDSTETADRIRGIKQLDGLGAVGTADRHRVTLRQEGHMTVPPRPRESTRSNPAGLTNRQLDVARLVARGHSNAEIAARLYISPKTADHHVSAILTKLSLTNRRAVVVRAAELGLA